MVRDNPSGPIGAMFLGTLDPSGEPGIVVAFEQPQTAPGFTSPVQKEVLERSHLERFRHDHLLRRGAVPFEDVKRGGDPPDFVVKTTHGEERLDCAILANESRRRAHHLFAVLRQRLFDGAGGRSFAGIAGTLAAVSFGSQLDELPPRRTDDSIVDDLLDALSEAIVDRQVHESLMEQVVQSGGFPQQLPPGAITQGSTPDGVATFVANVLYPENRIPPNLPGGLPFLLQLHFPQRVTRGEVETELQRLATKHDKGRIQHLLVSSGAPNREGICFPAEETFARLLFEGAAVNAVTTTHISKVSLHLWSAAEAFDIPISRSGRPKAPK